MAAFQEIRQKVDNIYPYIIGVSFPIIILFSFFAGENIAPLNCLLPLIPAIIDVGLIHNHRNLRIRNLEKK
jgi:hypothetical protein